MAQMRYRLLGATGLRVSELCLGAMVFGDTRGSWGASQQEAARIVRRFAQAARHWPMAPRLIASMITGGTIDALA